jgi:hypothetical protein
MNSKSGKSAAELLNVAKTAINTTPADEQRVSTMALLGYQKAELEEGKRRYEAAENASAALMDAEETAKDAAIDKQAEAKNAVRRAATKRNKALKALRKWLTPYLKLASIAFEGKKDVLEKLGIVTDTKAADPAAVSGQSDAVSGPDSQATVS